MQTTLAKPRRIPEVSRFKYDPREHAFPDMIKACLVEGKFVGRANFELENLHQVLRAQDLAFINTSDFTKLTYYFFDLFDAHHPIADLYVRFLSEVIKPRLGLDRLVYQNKPAMRFIFPRQPSMIPGKDRYGSFHADCMNGHPPGEINFWIPFTPCRGSNSLQMVGPRNSERLVKIFEKNWLLKHGKSYAQSLHDATKHIAIYGLLGKEAVGLAKPLEGGPGDVFSFSPYNVHGTLLNRTKSTRVSMDIRVMSFNDYERLDREYKSLSGKFSYKIGGLYSVC